MLSSQCEVTVKCTKIIKKIAKENKVKKATDDKCHLFFNPRRRRRMTATGRRWSTPAMKRRERRRLR
jgi:hypothetical protein